MSGIPRELPPDLRRVGRSFCTEAARYQTVGAALAVRTTHGETLDLAYGRRCEGQAGEVNSRTVFRWGSISKVVTGLAVVSALTSRDISTDTTIERWIPELANSWAGTITVSSLLSHTSGLDALNEDAPRRSVADFLSWIQRHSAGKVPTPHVYSNTNYVLLGLLLQRVTGLRWEQAVRDLVLGPLGLQGVLIDPISQPADDTACGHLPGAAPISLGEDYRDLLVAKPWLRPAGALSGTADKLAHLGVFFLHGHPPSDALAHAREFMRTPAGVASPSGPTPLTNGALLFTPGMYAGSLTPPAPGHQATTDEALDVLYHRGATTTYHAELYIFRRRDQPLRAVTGGGHAGGVIAILDSSRHVYGATLAAASRALSAPSN